MFLRVGSAGPLWRGGGESAEAPADQLSGIYMHEGTLLFHERAIKNPLSVIEFVVNRTSRCKLRPIGLEARSPIRGGGVSDRAKLMSSPVARKAFLVRRRAPRDADLATPFHRGAGNQATQMVWGLVQGKCENLGFCCKKGNDEGWLPSFSIGWQRRGLHTGAGLATAGHAIGQSGNPRCGACAMSYRTRGIIGVPSRPSATCFLSRTLRWLHAASNDVPHPSIGDMALDSLRCAP